MAVDIAAAFLIAVLSGLGVGSGGLLVIYLTLLGGVNQVAAQGINLVFFLFSSGAALFRHIRRGNILWGAVLIMSAAGILGAVGGSICATVISPAVIRKIFGVFLLASGSIAFLSGLCGKKK